MVGSVIEAPTHLCLPRDEFSKKANGRGMERIFPAFSDLRLTVFV